MTRAPSLTETPPPPDVDEDATAAIADGAGKPERPAAIVTERITPPETMPDLRRNNMNGLRVNFG